MPNITMSTSTIFSDHGACNNVQPYYFPSQLSLERPPTSCPHDPSKPHTTEGGARHFGASRTHGPRYPRPYACHRWAVTACHYITKRGLSPFSTWICKISDDLRQLLESFIVISTLCLCLSCCLLLV